MEVSVKMQDKEFQEFMRYRAESERYSTANEGLRNRLDYWARTVLMALEESTSGKIKIADKDQAAELLELAGDYIGGEQEGKP